MFIGAHLWLKTPTGLGLNSREKAQKAQKDGIGISAQSSPAPLRFFALWVFFGQLRWLVGTEFPLPARAGPATLTRPWQGPAAGIGRPDGRALGLNSRLHPQTPALMKTKIGLAVGFAVGNALYQMTRPGFVRIDWARRRCGPADLLRPPAPCPQPLAGAQEGHWVVRPAVAPCSTLTAPCSLHPPCLTIRVYPCSSVVKNYGVLKGSARTEGPRKSARRAKERARDIRISRAGPARTFAPSALLCGQLF